MKAIVLVAGYATRMYPLTLNKPKHLLEVAGKPILEHIVEKLEELEEIDEIIIVANAKFFEQFSEWMNGYSEKAKKKIRVLNDGTLSNEDRLGSIGDINFVVEKCSLNDELFVLAADNIFDFSLREFVDFFKAKGAACILVHESPDVETARGHAVMELDSEGKVLHLEEKPENPKTMTIGKALYLYPKEVCGLFREYLDAGENKDAPGYFVEWLYKAREVFAYSAEGKGRIFNIDSKEALAEADEYFKGK